MPRKSASPAPAASTPIAAEIAARKARKPRGKADRNTLSVALWIGPSAKPKKWFKTVLEAKAHLAGCAKLAGQEVHIAELKKVTLSFAINIADDKLPESVQQ